MTGHPLDRPVWAALSGVQAPFAEGGAAARRFAAAISPLAAPADLTPEATTALAALIARGDEIALLEPMPPQAPAGVEASVGGTCLQMIAPALTPGPDNSDIAPLGEADAPEMLALTKLTGPGPFRTRTHTLGRFLGIRAHGHLVAMAGERLNAEGFTEISAVCTHPDHRGQGLGAALTRAVGSRILEEGRAPFLHCYATNTAAVALYRNLGFDTRCEIVHVIWKRV